MSPSLSSLLLALCVCLCAYSSAGVASKLGRVAVFGASGGVGQQICSQLVKANYKVTAVSRNPSKLVEFPLLVGCDTVAADARVPETLPPALAGLQHLVICVGTTAFPTSKWEGGNTPQAACYDTVVNILSALRDLPVSDRPQRIALLSSIGVERRDAFPFKILNLYGVLEWKRRSEEVLLEQSAELGITPIVCRPGRLVGAPFTNFDLAKLLNKDQGSDLGIILDTRDVLAGDVERADVAQSVVRMLGANLVGPVNYSIINKPGEAPGEADWGRLLSLFTVSQEDLLTTRSS
ncbi:hypothetical protein B484DRAFT_448134 [Ochromonadaceae sp. CCMP2298]|nr:hypothetical protein B484DRAFT_448134 [Ochromonadaceae sp. CCMP2298]